MMYTFSRKVINFNLIFWLVTNDRRDVCKCAVIRASRLDACVVSVEYSRLSAMSILRYMCECCLTGSWQQMCSWTMFL